MKWFAVHTREVVHGVYHVQAGNEDEARKILEEQPHKAGEQKLYEAYGMDITNVEPL